MAGYVSFLLDLVLIGLLSTGIFYAVRLSQRIAGLSASREEMERFVLDFSATVGRAEAGVRGLKQAARSSGDDLEQLIEKAQSLRDELHFLVESAEKIADRLSDTAGAAARSAGGRAQAPADEKKLQDRIKPVPETGAAALPAKEQEQGDLYADAASAAERNLLQALRKLG